MMFVGMEVYSRKVGFMSSVQNFVYMLQYCCLVYKLFRSIFTYVIDNSVIGIAEFLDFGHFLIFILKEHNVSEAESVPFFW